MSYDDFDSFEGIPPLPRMARSFDDDDSPTQAPSAPFVYHQLLVTVVGKQMTCSTTKWPIIKHEPPAIDRMPAAKSVWS